MTRILALLLACIVGSSALAKTRAYSGDEASALRCANMIALTAMVLEGADLISSDEQQVMIGVTVAILDLHVSGNWATKKRALAVVRDRRSPEETIEDFKANAALCLMRFPIN